MATVTQQVPYASASLYVGDLVPDVTEALLFEIFNAVGPVSSVRVCRDAATRRSLGYSYVNFHRVEDAERALDTKNFELIRGKACRIMWSHRDPALRKSGKGNIFVKNLAPTIDNKSLYDTFSVFGNILSCKVSTKNGQSLGYGFVHFENEESAQTAIAKADGKIIANQKVEVAIFKARDERPVREVTFTNIYVKNLPLEMKQEEFEKTFSQFGKVTSSVIQMNKDGQSKGFGFINFEKCADAETAVKAMNGYKISEDKELVVTKAQKKADREQQLRDHFESIKMERSKKYEGVNLYIKNLSDDITDDGLREEFKSYGEITSARIMLDATGKSRGFGFVCFSSAEEATKAVTEMNGKMFNGKPLYVALAQRKDARRAQLESRYAARSKMGAVQPQMYPQGAMFYQNAVGVPRNFMYQQMPNFRQGPNGQGQMMAGMQPQQGRNNMSYALVRQRGPNPSKARRQRNPNVRQPSDQKTQEGPMTAGPLTTSDLAAAPEEMRKQMIGERLFPLVAQHHPELAGKITGMLLEMDNGELIHLLENKSALTEKLSEALAVLQSADATED